MLLNLHIKNMALIDEIDINFEDNLNILTGETGAGKSIVIDSIMLALGGKMPKDFVRKDAEYGLVELLFSIEDSEVIKRLQELEVMDITGGELILSRKIIGNRSVSKVNGETVTLTKIREIADLLLDLHAQHEHQSLLIPGNHLKLLDRYGHDTLDSLKEEVCEIYKEYAKIKTELLANTMDEEEKRRKLDLMEFERNEIMEASLRVGEDDELEEQYRKASNSKNITESVSNAYHFVEDSAYEEIDRAVRQMTSVSEYDKELESMTDMLFTVSDLISDFGRSARNYLEENTFSDEDFRLLEERLNTVNHLKAKYGKTIEAVLAYGEQLDKQYEKVLNQEQYLAELRQKLASVEKQLETASEELSQERKRVATELSANIKNALVDLNFLDVQFDMVFEKQENYSASGFDNPYFIISTNIGEEMKPLWQVASGGELSRIMLAMKSCLADADRINTLIFDEIDVGISGRTAQMVAEKIHGIGKNHQVICITHLPQIAAMANHHYLIEKQACDGKTTTSISQLDSESEIMELARLIGGVKITDTVIQSAKEMKELAVKAKVN
ncbi:MAG: DNA repair protein RecN [Lachnospiraceae bacterium]|nr:DNA repair protein RecN [Lachnospiraceae bacterium]